MKFRYLFPIPQIAMLFTLVLVTGCVGFWPNSATTPQFPTLVLYDWEDDLPQSVLDAFTQEYGIPVEYVTYENRDEAIANLRAGKVYDVVVMDDREIPALVRDGLLARISPEGVTNFMNISPNFRDLIHDPGNRYTVPYNWGTSGMLVRSDLAGFPVRRWADLWSQPPLDRLHRFLA